MSSDFQYAGYYYHAPSGLSLTRARAYNSNSGRWINRDPIGENGGLNLYAYVGNAPVNRSDPEGLQGSCKKQLQLALPAIAAPPVTAPPVVAPPSTAVLPALPAWFIVLPIVLGAFLGGDNPIPTPRTKPPREECEDEAEEELTTRQGQCWQNYLSDRKRHGEAQAQANKRRCEETATITVRR